MKKTFVLSAAAVLVVVGAVPFTHAASGGQKGKPGSSGAAPGSTACNEGTVTWSPTSLWPPNHKLRTITISYDENDGDGDEITVEVTGIKHDQVVPDLGELVGSGKPNAGADFIPGLPGKATDPDAAQTSAQVRAERSGTREEGRTYTISVKCTDPGHEESEDQEAEDEQTQTVEITVTVPHDRSKG